MASRDAGRSFGRESTEAGNLVQGAHYRLARRMPRAATPRRERRMRRLPVSSSSPAQPQESRARSISRRRSRLAAGPPAADPLDWRSLTLRSAKEIGWPTPIDAFHLSDPELRPDRREGGGRRRVSTPPTAFALYATADLLGLGRLAEFANAAPERRPRPLLRQPAHQPDQRLRPAEHLRLLLVRPDAEGGGRLHPLARGGLPRGGAGARACRRASSTSSAACIPSSG